MFESFWNDIAHEKKNVKTLDDRELHETMITCFGFCKVSFRYFY